MPRQGHAAQLVGALDEVADLLEGQELDDRARVVLKFKASTRLNNGPFSKLRMQVVGEGQGWSYFALSTSQSRELLSSLLGRYATLPDGDDIDWEHPKTWAFFLDSVDGIELYGPLDRADASLNELAFDPVDTVECLLWPSTAPRVAQERVADVVATIEGTPSDVVESRVLATDPRPDVTLVRASVTPSILKHLLDHPDIERVRAPLSLEVTQHTLARTRMPTDVPKPTTTVIGVIDGVVSTTNPLTARTLVGAAGFPIAHTFAGPDPHGTAVAGTAAWGDLDLLAIHGSLRQPHRLASARVLDSTPSGKLVIAGTAHTTIEEAIRWAVTEHAARIVNLSLNYPHPAADSVLKDVLTYTLDCLARELNVVIVVSAGNRAELPAAGWLPGYPNYLGDHCAGIAAPGDAALAVTVGSTAERTVPSPPGAFRTAIAPTAGAPSPFTRTGPVITGTTKSMKPEVTHHGGNWTWDAQNQSLVAIDPGTAAVVAVQPLGTRIVGSDTGTSFSAPAVAYEIGRIADRYPSAGANLLRALAGLSAHEHRYRHQGLPSDIWGGYGKPDADRVLESGPRRVFLTYEGEMKTGSVTVHRLPIPIEFAEGVRTRALRVALVFDPPVRRSRREYIAGTMSVELVRGLDAAEVETIYQEQPSLAAAEADPMLIRHDLPPQDNRPSMTPRASKVAGNTLIRRDFAGGQWNPDHRDYFLVVAHTHSAWSTAQKQSYESQSYALAVEVEDRTASDIDLYALIRAELRQRVRVRR